MEHETYNFATVTALGAQATGYASGTVNSSQHFDDYTFRFSVLTVTLPIANTTYYAFAAQ